MKTLISVFGLLVTVFISDDQVSGFCSSKVANTDWATCLPGNSCPHNFVQLDDDMQCGVGNICCLMRPTFDLNVKDAPCIIGGVSEGNDVVKNKYRSHH